RFQARRTLGEYPGFSLAEARRKAESWRQLARRGIDPATVEEEERRRLEAERVAAAARRENTLASYAEEFISERRNRRAQAGTPEPAGRGRRRGKSGECSFPRWERSR